MAIRLYKAYSLGTRFKSVSSFDDLSFVKLEKTLTFGKKASGGRNNRGVITVKGCSMVSKKRSIVPGVIEDLGGHVRPLCYLWVPG